MLLTIEREFQNGDKALYPIENSGMTYFMLVKIDDVLKIDKVGEDTYKIYYTAKVYVTPPAGTEVAETTNKLKALTVEESKLIKLDVFNNDIVTKF